MMQDKSNVAVFSLAYAPFEGGAEIAAREVAKRLDGLNFAVFTYKFARHWLSQESRGNTAIIRLGKGSQSGSHYGHLFGKIAYIFRAVQKAEAMHRQKRFEAVWAIMASYGGIAALLFKIKHPNIPLLVTIQEGDSERHLRFGKLGLVGFFWKRILRNADYIQAISFYLRDHIKKIGVSCPIEVIPNGVDINLFRTQYSAAEIKSVRENLGIKDEYVVITTSRLVAKNGVDILIAAIARFKEKRPNVRCLIIGAGPERAALERQARRLGVDVNVIFLGHIAQHDLPIYFRIADIFIRPSRSEGLGNSFLEAMAAGIPVIGTLVGGIADFLHDGRTGFIVPVDDPEAIAGKMHYIIGNSNVRNQVVQEASRLILDNYSWDMISKMFRNIFNKLIND